MKVALLDFNPFTGEYGAGGNVVDTAIRRAVSHPAAVGFVKRAVGSAEGEGEHVEVPVWGMILLGVSFYAAIIAMSLVSTLSLAS